MFDEQLENILIDIVEGNQQFEVCEIIPRLLQKSYKRAGGSEAHLIFANLAIASAQNPNKTTKVVLKYKEKPVYREQNYRNREEQLEAHREFRMEISLYNRFIYEIHMYRHIAQNIIAPHHCGNFIAYLGNGECGGSNDLPESKVSSSYAILMTQRPANTLTLHDFLKNRLDDVRWIEAYNCIVFQILYALLVLDLFFIMHNDLHSHNVLISHLSKPKTLYFKIPTYNNSDKYYKITTQHLVYIFDWDLSYTEALGDNPELNGTFCDTLNMCNKFNRGFDLYTLACSVDFFGFEEYKDSVPFHQERELSYYIYRKKITKTAGRTYVPNDRSGIKGDLMVKYNARPEEVIRYKNILNTKGVPYITVKSEEEIKNLLSPEEHKYFDGVKEVIFYFNNDNDGVYVLHTHNCRRTFVQTQELNVLTLLHSEKFYQYVIPEEYITKNKLQDDVYSAIIDYDEEEEEEGEQQLPASDLQIQKRHPQEEEEVESYETVFDTGEFDRRPGYVDTLPSRVDTLPSRVDNRPANATINETVVHRRETTQQEEDDGPD